MFRTILVVQARTGSSRLPGKVLLDACGKPLLELMLERLGKVRAPVRIVVATTTAGTDQPVVDLCRRLGVEMFRGHPTDLLDRHYRAGKIFGADAVAKIPSDCPLIDPAVVDRVLARFALGDCDYAGNLHPASYPDGNDVEVMTMEALKEAWREADKPMEREHTTPFLWERPERFRLANVLWEADEQGQPVRDYSLSHRWTLDYPEDYQFIRRVYEAIYPAKPDFRLDDILALLDAQPDLAAINAAYAGVNWYRHHLHELRTVDSRHTRLLDAALHPASLPPFPPLSEFATGLQTP
ncbi:cytidylyltransferase domain-containing protein [Methylomagnum sp.]